MFSINFNLTVADNCFVFIGLFGQPQGLSRRSHKFSNLMKHRLPLTRGLSFFHRKMTEGEKAINIKLSLSLLPSRLRRATYCPLAVSRFCLCGLERRTKSTAAPTDAPFIRHRRRSHMLPVRGRLYSASIFV